MFCKRAFSDVLDGVTPVSGCIGTTTLQKLQKLQNRAARVVTNSCFDAPSEPLIQQLGWLSIEELIE